MIKLVATIFAVLGVYLLKVVYEQPHWFSIILAAASLIAAVGLLLHKPWSQYFVYGVSFAVAGQWLWITIAYYVSVGWPSERTGGHIIALIPGSCIVALAIGCSVFAYRHFRVKGTPA